MVVPITEIGRTGWGQEGLKNSVLNMLSLRLASGGGRLASGICKSRAQNICEDIWTCMYIYIHMIG